MAGGIQTPIEKHNKNGAGFFKDNFHGGVASSRNTATIPSSSGVKKSL
jgi:hypothetical protein